MRVTGAAADHLGSVIVFVNEADGAMAVRAERFAAALGGRVLAKNAHPTDGRLAAILRSVATVCRARPQLVHVIDVGVAGLVVLMTARAIGARVQLDTGDEHHALMRRTDRYRGLALLFADVTERLCLHNADWLFARGRGHVAALQARGFEHVSWLPDGVDVELYTAATPHCWRSERGWQNALVVACVGSLGIDHRYRSTQGLELIQALPYAPAACAVIVGDGPGRYLLEQEAARLGVATRVAMLGWQPPAELGSLLKSFDVCLSTQTDDVVGHARTTGKLPLFLAAGRFVLASRVGEGARVLPDEMLLPYRGEHDSDYPRTLGRRLDAIAANRACLANGARGVATARQLFDYAQLVRELVRRTVANPAS